MTRRRNRNRPKRQESGILAQPFKQPQNNWSPYHILSQQQLHDLHEASMNILENIGVDFMDAEALDLWEAAGAKVDRATEHVWIDRGLVEQALETAPSRFTWRARNPAHDVVIGGNHLTFAPCGGMVYASDLDQGRR
ncbi:MAG: trimethylamine methyltransferase family protein, partial [Chloroflexota bacterium]